MRTRLTMFTSPMRGLLALALAATLPLFVAADSTPLARAADLPEGATLTILVPSVEVATGTGEFITAADGQLVRPGDVVRTGASGVALLTFFDGSETQLAGASQVEVKRADYSPVPHIALAQTAGVTVNRVIPLPPDGVFRTDTPDAIGLVRGTSYLVAVTPAASTPSGDPQVGSSEVAVCGLPAAGQGCISSVVLLTDLDGHVGRVDVMVPSAAGSSEAPIAVLESPGAMAAASAGSAASGRLSDTALEQLERSAYDLRDANAALQAADQAQEVARAVAPVFAPSMPASPETAPTVSPLVMVEQVSRPVEGEVGESRPGAVLLELQTAPTLAQQAVAGGAPSAPAAASEPSSAAAPTTSTEPMASTRSSAPSAPSAPAASTAPTTPALTSASSAASAPTSPTVPTPPTTPAAPTSPTAPTAPTSPTAPTVPTAPTAPTAPSAPTAPNAPTAPTAPSAPTDAPVAAAPSAPTTPTAPTTPNAPTTPSAPTVPSAPSAPAQPKTAPRA